MSKNQTISNTDWETELVVLAANDRSELIRKVRGLAEFLADRTNVSLKDVAASCGATVGEEQHRLAIVAGTPDELHQRLLRAAERLDDEKCRRISDGVGIYYTAEPLYPNGKLAFLFPGEGAQYVGMLKELEEHFPSAGEHFDWGDALLAADGDELPLSRFMRFPADAEKSERDEIERELRQLDNAMISVLLADWAIEGVLRSLGLEPDVIAGHSAGELSALWGAGCIDPEAEHRVIPEMREALREQESAKIGEEAGLLAVGASRDTAAEVIGAAAANIESGAQVYIAMDNCPHQTVLVGHATAIEAVEVELRARKLMYERLPFSKPYHTHLFEPYLVKLAELFEGVAFCEPSTPIYSCTTGRLFPNDPDEVRRLMLAHWARPVEFRRMIENMYADGVRIFVEVGPRGNLTSFVSDILRGKEMLAVSADVQHRTSTTQLNHFVGQLVAHHVPVRLAELFVRRDPHHIDWEATGTTKQTPPATNGSASQSARSTAATAPAPSFQANGASVQQQASASLDNRPVAVTAQAASNRETIVNRHFEVMDQFMTDQRLVVETFLKNRGRRSKRRTKDTAVTEPARRAGARRRGSGLKLAGRNRFADATAAETRSQSRDFKNIAIPRVSSNPNSAIGPDATSGAWPLLGEMVDHQPGQRLVMRRRMDLGEDCYAAEHTVGGRDVSRVDPDQHGLPVMPMTFNLELMAEVATLLVPGQRVLGLDDVRIQRWLAFDEAATVIGITAEVQDTGKSHEVPEVTRLVRVEVCDLGTADAANESSGAVVAVGTVLLGKRYPEAPRDGPIDMSKLRKPQVTIEQSYKNLFHGPQFQGLIALDAVGENEIHSRIKVQPRDRLFRSTSSPRFLLDPVTVDIAMHPSVGWHLEQPDQSGRILLPYELKSVRFYGPCPVVGDEFTCRSYVRHTSVRQFILDGDIFDSRGRMWCQLIGVRSWRFYLPFGEVNFHGPKDEYFLTKDWQDAIGEPTESDDSSNDEPFGGLRAENGAESWCVRMEPSPDLLQPSMQLAAVKVTMSPTEQRFLQNLSGDPSARTNLLYERIAAKDAVRILWRLQTDERFFPADIEIETDDYGRLSAQARGGKRNDRFPRVASASCGQTMVAVATMKQHVGVALVAVTNDSARPDVISAEEEKLIDPNSSDREEAVARFRCAKQAVAGALGSKLVESTSDLHVRRWNPESGEVEVALATGLSATFPEFQGSLIRVFTSRREDIVVGTTFCETGGTEQ